MKHIFKTEQEAFWQGEFGTQYTSRNSGSISATCALFARILSRTTAINSVIEFGANIGLNLKAIDVLLPECKKAAVEINAAAIEQLSKMQPTEIFHESALGFESERKWDLVLTKGLLIHINPDELGLMYDKLFSFSSRYICVAEYYNPQPVSIPYRGHLERLFKRDFAGELLDRFSSLRLVDYGFCYHRDPNFPQDDITWFLLEKV